MVRVRQVVPDSEYLNPATRRLGPARERGRRAQQRPVVPEGRVQGKTDAVYLRLEFAIPDGKGGLKTIKDITGEGAGGRTCRPRASTFRVL